MNSCAMYALRNFRKYEKRWHINNTLFDDIFKIKKISSSISYRNFTALHEGFQDIEKKISYQNAFSDKFGNIQEPLEKLKKKQVNFAEFKDKSLKGRYESKNSIDKPNFSNVFGKATSEWDLSDDENCGDIDVDSRTETPLDIKSTMKYLKEMKELVRSRKLKEALQLFDEMKMYGVFPRHAHYTFMIGACGRVGYTEMAFKLLKQMTDRQYIPTPATLTGLFNSCSECPYPEYGLRKALHLREKIKLKMWQLAPPTYHAMIKAFGRCGDMESAFEVFEELIETGERISIDAYSFLLMSCINNKEAGFTYAIEVWRKMISKKMTPTIFSYNLLLRSIRDCGVGPEEVSCNLLQHWSSFNKREFFLEQPKPSENYMQLLPDGDNVKLLTGSTNAQEESYVTGEVIKRTSVSTTKKTNDNLNKKSEVQIQIVKSSSLENISNKQDQVVLNILGPRCVNGTRIVELGKIKSPSDRLLLVGGVKGFLQLMKNDNVKPSVKTFTMLLNVIPGNFESENELLSLMDEYHIVPDVDFFNMLIKKRNFRSNFKAAKDVLIKIKEKCLYPDIVTFGVLALGCTKRSDGLQLLDDLNDLKIFPNVEIIGALLNCACKERDCRYIMELLKKMKILGIKPSKQMLIMLEKFKDETRKDFLTMKLKGTADILASEKSFHKFCTYYEQWLKTVSVELPVDPWVQYQPIRDEDVNINTSTDNKHFDL